MYYLGIDVGKNNHEAGLVKEDGAHVGKLLRFANTLEGFELLLLFLEQRLPEQEAFCIGMEATGHYWLALYSFLREQGFDLHVIDKKIAKQLKKLSSVILTIPGVGPATGAIVLDEIGDIGRFSNPKKLVAFAGIDPTSFQSGNYVGRHNRLSKKGSPYLRRVVWMSALIAVRCDPVFKAFYEKKRDEGKAHRSTLGAVSRKLLYTIHAVLKANKPYEVRPQGA
ncbi:MAG: transposase [Synergistes jonesii]|uniref:transposase n=1 Tax=Synergistes jonesii TaxID=2754 RepID=UPI002A74B398|nr:transposase [Synergistes jonesii]MDY2985228.1 transposase [Synergistes jonesii]